MIKFKTIIQKFGDKGEKTGWTYIEIPIDLAEKLKPNNKMSFRVKGKLDDHTIKQTAIIPMGDGNFILPLNAAMRKAIGKKKGYELTVQLQEDKSPLLLSKDMMACFEDDPKAIKHFKSLPKSHQNYFSKWIESAKTEPTKAKRIAMAVNALSKGWGFPEMLRAQKKE